MIFFLLIEPGDVFDADRAGDNFITDKAKDLFHADQDICFFFFFKLTGPDDFFK